ncbi:MAG: amino acid adenylation domain-containing protein [Longimicrobiaceae bacterium]
MRAGSGAAFSVDDGGEERLVVVQEVSRQASAELDVEEVAAAIRRAVAGEHGVQVHAVAVARTGGVPKTTSGKVQRRACRAAFLAGDLPLVGVSVREDAGSAVAHAAVPGLTREALEAAEAGERQALLEAYLVERAAQVLGVDPAGVDREQPLVGLGMDSLRAMELKGALEASLGAPVPLASLLDDTRIDRLAADLLEAVFLADATAPASSTDTEGGLPLSFAQERLWFLERLQPESAAYTLAGALRLEGAVDAAVLRRSLAETVRRHAALRTVFGETDGRPVQRVLPAGGLPLPEVDVSHLAPEERAAAARRAAEAVARTPFDLAAGPLFRARLVRLGGDEHLLVLAMHHIVGDGGSVGVLIREIAALYRALLAGEPSPLPPLPTQYADWALGQRERLRSATADEQLAWWRERLRGLAPLPLPTDHPRPPVQSFRGATHRFEVPAEVMDGVRALARSEGATPFMVLLAAWDLLLARYGGEGDVAVGTTVSSRDRAEVAGVVGLFVDTLVLRTEVAPEASFRALLSRARTTALEAFARRDLPFQRVVDEVLPGRDLSLNPLFQVMLAPQNTALEPVEIAPGVRLLPEPVDRGAATFDLTFLTWERSGGGLAAALEYATDLFEAATVRRMADHLVQLLRAVAADPDLAVAEVPLLLPAEREQVLEEWNDTAAEYPERCLHELFAEQAARTPDAPALRFAGRTTTYAELERSTHRLARHLLALGVGPEARVGLCVERTPEMVAAMLGILGAGAAYVPLDPAYPAERLAYMLADSGAALVVAHAAVAERLPAGVPCLLLDAESEAIAAHPDSAPTGSAEPGNLAYVLYTSGSTGRPKGVQVEHRSASQIVHFLRDVVRPEDRAAVLGSTSISFDVSVGEIFGTLCWGGMLVLVESVLDLPRVAEEDVRLVVTVPGAVAELVRTGGIPGSVRAFNLAGEALPASLARELYALPHVERVLNLYGPTEDTVYSTWSVVERGAERVRIGRPVANARAYVLDPAGSPAPIGVAGELCLGGRGTARGYQGRPELTAERFVPDPFAGEPGARMYRTGDRARWLASGELEYLGRLDEQVKVRGFRIEPGEVEAVLREAAGVADAAVVARADGEGQSRLVAYVVPQEGEEITGAALRQEVRARLPEYMVPAAFVVMDKLPLNASGKLDRRALPEPAPEDAPEPVAPRTPAEEVVCGIFAEVLGTGRVGAEDDFFERGGHSLLAMRAVARAGRALGVEVPLRALFEARTAAGLAGRAEALRSAGAREAPPVERLRDVPGGAAPLSFAQQRLWLVDRLEPGSAAYNMAGALRLRGPLDAAALRAGIGALLLRHESLRTTFEERAGAPVQVVHAPTPAILRGVDLGRVPGAEREREAARLAAEEALRPFDLERGPLLRTTLLRLAADDHVLLFTLHHVVGDGWSMDVLRRELSALYAAFGRGEDAHLPEPPVRYADFAVWQRAWLSGEVLEAQLRFWKRALRDAPPLLEIPTDRPRAAGLDARSASHRFAVPAGVADGLRALARREGATLFMTTLAGWQALLGRWAGQDDVVVGSPVAGRTRVETEGVVGFFVNMLALRGDLSGDPAWTALLERVRETALGAYDHQELPFERLVEELDVERSLAHSPVFQATFALDRAAAHDGLSLGVVAVEPFGAGAAASKFDLELTLHEGEAGLAGTLAYRASLFEAGTVARLAGHLELLLAAMAEDPGSRVHEVPLLRGGEREQVLHGWNDTAAEYPERCLHELFAEQAARTPDAPALRFGGRTVSYAELERSANQLARHLRALGVGPEARVGLCVERTPEMVAAMLGILGAGAAYVPLDPAYPAERLAYMLADSGAALVVAHAAVAERLPAGVPRVLLDAEAEAIAAHPGGAPAVAAEPGNLAYVLYTSGSTGRPKGVQVEHRSASQIVHFLRAAVRAEDRAAVLGSTSISFDVSVGEIFGTLCWGGTLVLVESVLDLPRVAEEDVRLVVTVPGAVAELVRTGGIPGSVRAFNLAGEALPASLVRDLYARPETGRVLNLYGPTEDTVYSTWSEVERGAERVCIGRPVANARAYVLDPAGSPAPIGVAGELCLGGRGTARGYQGRPELTAERFVPDAFAAEPGARMYRTGDRARWLASGELEYLGRLDEQVKVRGFRIEPGEVEAVLAGLPQVREAVVVARADGEGQGRLVAYVVPEEGEEVTGAGLRQEVRARLPEHMVPAAFVVMDRLPLNTSGKLDRRALPEPRWGAEGARVAPRTATEAALCAVWAEVLGREGVGVHDNFFELGGHSLLATRVVSRLRELLGVELPVRALFEAPTVAALAGQVDAGLAAGRSALAPIPRRAGTGPSPLSFAQQRLWFIHRLDPASSAYNVPFALRLRGAPDPGALRRALTELVRRHEAVRTVLVEEGGEPMQVVLAPAPVRLPVVELAGLPPEPRRAEALRRVADEARRPFDLERGPLLRALLARLGADEWVLCFTMHHVVSDGWSMGVLVREVSALYGAYSRGEASPLPEPEVQYADFAAWQREWLAGGLLEAQLAYWRGKLEGAPRLLELPLDHPRTSAIGVTETGRTFVLSAETTRGLRELGLRGGATLFMTLLAGWQALLGRYAGSDDVVVGTPIANRTRAELEGLIGFFVNTLVLRGDLSGEPGFRALLERARETTLGAFAHQDLPFERLVEELEPERSLTQNPLFQVMFALQNTDRGVLALGGLAVEPLAVGDTGAKFDLGVMLFEAGERIEGRIDFRTDLFDASTIDRMAEHFRLLLEGAVAAPDRRVSELRLLGAAEERRLLAEWNAPRAYPADRLVPHLLAEQAERTPGAAAVSGGGAALTYAELDARSGRLARALRGLGVGPDVPVGVLLERGPWLLEAVLGIWKAGGAYLPLDPAYPADRLEYMLRDAAAPVLVTQERLAGTLPPHSAAVVLLDADTARLAAESPAPPPVRVDGNSLAYVIYTSGSTGRPKGVRVAHSALLNTLLAAREAFDFAGGEETASVASFAFDIWLFEAVLPLLAGGSVRLVPREEVLDTPRLVEGLAGCASLHAVPALMREIVRALRGSGRALPGLRQAFVGGDAVAPELLEEMREVFPAAAVHVLYGPTEGAVICASHGAREGERKRQWVGRPLGNAALYVLDRAGQPAPVGVPGELCIGAGSAARDYLGRPELTAERFVPDPFAGEAGARMYRTGDRVRWGADGELEFLGRVDFQVKIRGFRIEPGEVEAVLAEHPDVEAAAVVVLDAAPGADPGDRRLAGYVVPAREPAAGAAELQAEYVREWESLFGDTYAAGGADADPAFNVAGWNSSYTGEPIPAAEMREWVESAATSLRALRPRRVLEIGAGTGLLLFRLAPECEEYWAADFSAAAVAWLRGQAERPGRELPGVRVLERAADDFSGIPERRFDLVVVNSVAQYFPGVDYLLRVLEGAVAALAPGGRLWVGDVRSLPLREAFHASVELARAPDASPARALLEGARRRAAREKELLVDPDLFRALPARLPRVSGVEVRLKPGRHANEMTRFRYDVLLHVEADLPRAAPRWRRWDELGSLDAVRLELEAAAPETLAVARVPNPRVAGALAVVEALGRDAPPESAGELRALAAEREARGPDPGAFRELAEARGYRAHARPALGGGPGEYDVLLVREGAEAALLDDAPVPLPWSAYASDPLAALRGRWLLPELRAWLRERLPEYMVPAALVRLETLPLTPSGKVDRRALPAPEAAGADAADAAPRTPVQEVLAGIWAAVLGLEQVGVATSFFELGGHSLLATQVVSRVRRAFGVELPLRALFEAPTVAALAARVEALLGPERSAVPIPRRAGDGPAPLSFAQQRLWFIHQLDPASSAYNMPASLRLRGALDVRALRRALAEVVRRHEAVRTILVDRGGEPVQVVLPAGPLPFPVLDLAGLPEALRRAEAQRQLAADGLRPFDLRRGPLLRVLLVRIAADEWALGFTMHHVVSDGWSMGVLAREVSALYAAYSRGGASPLPELEVQYADFAVWQRGWLAGEALDAQLRFWREALEGAPPVLELPLDRPRGSLVGVSEVGRAFEVAAATTRGLRALARRESATLFMTLLAAWQTLLGRYASQDDVVVGTPIANRTRAELEGIIGFFVNTLVLRGDLSGDPRFRELLERTREATLGAFAHQDLPFERLVEELAPERSLTHNPLFQVMFALQNVEQASLSLGDVEMEALVGGDLGAKFDVGVMLFEDGDRLHGRIEYRPDLFDAATAERMAEHFRLLLEGAVAAPDRRISELRLMSPAEEHRVLVEWNPRRALPSAPPVPLLLAGQAERTPGAVAAVGGGATLTFGELDARSGRLASALRRLGVGPDTPVGVLLERGPRLLEAVLGIWKAGGAYLPLDPSHPADRLEYMLRDAAAPVLVTQERLAGTLPSGGAAVLVLEEIGAPDPTLTPRPPLPMLGEGENTDDSSSVKGRETHPQTWGRVASLSEPGGGDLADASEVPLDPDSLAYVIYTSGSTGRPKGVRVTHRALARTLLASREAFGFREGEETASLASFAFDIWLHEAVLPLLAGGSVRLVPREELLDTARLVEGLAGCASLHAVPALMREIVRTLRSSGRTLPGLRQAFVGGDAVPPDLLDEMREAFPAAALYVLYGPTEGTIICASRRVREGDPGRQWVGRSLGSARLYVLDRALGAVPAGVPGELCIAGASVARDYLGRPELTADRFVPDPWGGEPGARMYRTGDRVRWTADGELEFLGRVDFQVKIRGFRIEPGEVEAVLAGHPGVREAAVAVREAGPGDPGAAPGERYLVGYVVPARDGEGAPGVELPALRSWLRERLPEYMVPGALVARERLPLAPSGKVDRRALPAPERAGAAGSGAPLTPTEQAVAGIWEEVLGVPGVGAADNFFDLGGHSLLLVQVHARLQERFPGRIALTDLFTHPTLGSLAAQLAPPTAPEAPRARPAFARPAPRRPRTPLADAGAARREADTPVPETPMHQSTEPAGRPAVAIIGMAGRFPGASDIEGFWRNLRTGTRAIRRFTEREMAAAGVPPREFRAPGYVPVSGVVEGAELFDAAFFGFTPGEALVMNPQQRVFLECAWEALERAGCASRTYPGRIGVYASEANSAYILNVLSNPSLVQAVGEIQIVASNYASVATVASFKFGLEGPSLNVHSACSSSLVAVHLACQSLLLGEMDVALAGGVKIGVPHQSGYQYQPGGIMSPTGECSPFDAGTRGSVPGNGAGVVVLKRLDDALADGDLVHAVIRGSAINNDGDRKVGFTAPRWEGQAAAISDALAAAGVEPEQVSFVETHGSGTEVGDPIEVAALAAVHGEGRPGSCALGAVKADIGHLDVAAGVVGLIKAALALEHGEIPPAPYFRAPNPAIGLERTPFYVNPEPRPWTRGAEPRRAGVSSFGIGGTNAHVVLEEAPAAEASEAARSWHLLVLSAKTASALEAATDRLAAHLRAHPEQELADVANTLQVGRRAFEHRRVLVARDGEDAAAALEARAPQRVVSGGAPEGARPVAFLFSGVGDHYPQMGRGLYETEPVFRAEVDRCAEILRPHLGLDLREVLYPGDAPEEAGDAAPKIDLRAMLDRASAGPDDAAERLNATSMAQAALFVVEYALAKQWMAWGVKPEAMIGHSLGEYVAAAVAGVFSLEDALMLVAERSRLIEELPEGAMLGLPMGEAEVLPLLRDGLAVGTVNGPGMTVVSGPVDAVSALEAELAGRGVACRRLPTRHAFHSPMMAPVAERLAELMRRVKLSAPEIPFVSNVTGTWIRSAEATDPGYWSRHLVGTVRFAEGIESLAGDGRRVLLEVGPGQTLGTFVRQLRGGADAAESTVVASLRHGYERHSDVAFLLGAAGRLWLAGVHVDWAELHAHERLRRVPLPTYPFERRRFWIEPRAAGLPGAARGGDPLAKKPDPAEWLYLPAWKRAPLAATASTDVGEWLVLADDAGIGARLAGRLEALGHAVVVVEAGDGFARVGDRGYTARPGSAEDMAALREALLAAGANPRGVVHLWGVDPLGGDDADAFGRAQARGYATLAALARTFARDRAEGPLRVTVVTEGVQDVAGGEATVPARATVLGACVALPQEHAHVSCRAVDVLLQAGGAERLVEQLLAEVTSDAADAVVAYRGPRRWARGYEAVRPAAGGTGTRRGGAYLFSGALAGGSEVLAEHLAAEHGARLAVVVDPAFPERERWDARLAAAPEDSSAMTIRGIRAAEHAGAEVLLVRAGAEDAAALAAATAEARARFGALHGVVHAFGLGAAGERVALADAPADAAAADFARVARELAALEEALEGVPLDFCVLQNSLLSVFGGAGLGAATAASVLVDAWAQRHAAERGGRWTGVDWDRWHLDAGEDAIAGTAFDERAILRAEGARAFERIVELAHEPRVVVSTHDLDARIEQFLAPRGAHARHPQPDDATLHSRPELGNAYHAPTTEAEEILVGVWQELLGIGEIGVHDDFFHLGGHSLLATQLISRVRDTFQVELPLRAIFEAPTIARLAEVIEEAIILELEQMSDEEAMSLI